MRQNRRESAETSKRKLPTRVLVTKSSLDWSQDYLNLPHYIQISITTTVKTRFRVWSTYKKARVLLQEFFVV
jgi:hypothetical protein